MHPGRGWGGWPQGSPATPYAAPFTPKQEIDALEAQAQHLQASLEEIRSRITQLENAQGESSQ
jgi:hypothetical protein